MWPHSTKLLLLSWVLYITVFEVLMNETGRFLWVWDHPEIFSKTLSQESSCFSPHLNNILGLIIIHVLPLATNNLLSLGTCLFWSFHINTAILYVTLSDSAHTHPQLNRDTFPLRHVLYHQAAVPVPKSMHIHIHIAVVNRADPGVLIYSSLSSNAKSYANYLLLKNCPTGETTVPVLLCF